MNEEAGGAFVPTSAIYAELQRLTELVTRLDERASADRTPDTVKELETRVSSLEQRVWSASGAATVLGTLGGYAISFMTR